VIKDLAGSPAKLISCRTGGGSIDGSSKGNGGEDAIVIITEGSLDRFKGRGFEKFGVDVGKSTLRMKGTKGCENFIRRLRGEALRAEEPISAPEGAWTSKVLSTQQLIVLWGGLRTRAGTVGRRHLDGISPETLPGPRKKAITPTIDEILLGVVTETFRGAEKEGRKGGEETTKGPEFIGGDCVGGSSFNEGEEGDRAFREASKAGARDGCRCGDATRAEDFQVEGIGFEEPVKTILPMGRPLRGGRECSGGGGKGRSLAGGKVFQGHVVVGVGWSWSRGSKKMVCLTIGERMWESWLCNRLGIGNVEELDTHFSTGGTLNGVREDVGRVMSTETATTGPLDEAIAVGNEIRR
jgi:hypothetical protein